MLYLAIDEVHSNWSRGEEAAGAAAEAAAGVAVAAGEGDGGGGGDGGCARGRRPRGRQNQQKLAAKAVDAEAHKIHMLPYVLPSMTALPPSLLFLRHPDHRWLHLPL